MLTLFKVDSRHTEQDHVRISTHCICLTVNYCSNLRISGADELWDGITYVLIKSQLHKLFSESAIVSYFLDDFLEDLDRYIAFTFHSICQNFHSILHSQDSE
jgi:hypothetical protein